MDTSIAGILSMGQNMDRTPRTGTQPKRAKRWEVPLWRHEEVRRLRSQGKFDATIGQILCKKYPKECRNTSTGKPWHYSTVAKAVQRVK